MTKSPCGCDEKEVIISNIKDAIDYYEKDIEWVGLAQKRLNKVIDESIKSKSNVDFTKDLLKYKTILPLYLQICNLSVIEGKKHLEHLESEQCTHQNFMIGLEILKDSIILATPISPQQALDIFNKLDFDIYPYGYEENP